MAVATGTKLSQVPLTTSVAGVDTLTVTQGGLTRQVSVANAAATMPLASTVAVDAFDNLNLPGFPDLWVPVTRLHTATRDSGVWTLGAVVDTIGPAGPGYAPVGEIVGQSARPGISERDVVHVAWAQGAGFSTVGAVTSAVTGTQAAQAPAQNSPRANRLSATTASGVQGNAAFCCVGSAGDWAPGGFRFTATVRFPDASYNNTGAATGTRIGLGLSSAGTIATVLGADALANSWVGFVRRHVNGGATDTNWLIGGRGAGLTSADTGVAFAAGVWFTFDMAMAPGAASVVWSIVNRSTGARTSGTWATAGANLPSASTMLATFVGLNSVDAVTRNMDVARVAVVV